MSLTHKWLRDNVKPYPAPERVFADIAAALDRFPSLRPKSDIYTFDDGRTQLLLCLHGLLPISFRNAEYNIPVAVWVTHDFPREPPLAYVVPTQEMLVKPGPNLDVSGRSNLDYVQLWARKSEGCSLPALLDAMQAEFSKSPPVYAKPRATTASEQQMSRPTSSQPPEQLLRPISQDSRPNLPPKPQQGPSLPPKPQTPISAPSVPQPPPRPDLGPPQYRPAPPGYQTPAPSVQWIQTPPPPPLQQPIPNLLDEDTNAFLPPSNAPAPPRPPNPELLRLHTAVHAKFSTELASLAQALALDADRLRAHQADLLAGEPAIRDEMARLEAVRDVCRTSADRMRSSVQTAERNVAELRAKGNPSVDELVCSTTIVHNQLINLVAEDNAIEDTIFHLSKALNSGRIDLERFLRSCRLLAEEQFMKRALIDKIQNSIPMGHGVY
ncbi:UEV-domain-containing protein [Roridomyces roridus]|uniref:UEV-domain-containing protein n=1 Tax=Roridomyces roridus TaxID=1738132 RepID=A0AAD7BWP9_9AGAR|nr:UEV-domain-containing protein [Roridomyces roridus]